MAIEIVLDDASASSLDQLGNSGASVVRGGWAEGLPTDTTTMQPEDVLFAVRDAVYAKVPQGSTYPGTTNSFFNRVQVLGFGSTRARLNLFYEPFDGVGTSLIIDIGSSLSTFATNMMPGTRQPFALDFEATDGGESIPTDYPILNLLRPTRRVSVTQLQSGTLDVTEAASFGKNVGKVNNSIWQDEAIATWIIGEANASISRYAGYYSRRLSAITQGDVQSYYAILRSQLTGKYAGDADIIQSAVDQLKALPYEARRVVTGNGVLRADPYELTTFATLFGF